MKAALRRGQPVPEALDKAPTLMPWLHSFMSAFVELSTCRPLYQGGFGPIPWTAMEAYARRHRLQGHDFEELVVLIRAMDDAFMKHQLAKLKEKSSG